MNTPTPLVLVTDLSFAAWLTERSKLLCCESLASGGHLFVDPNRQLPELWNEFVADPAVSDHGTETLQAKIKLARLKSGRTPRPPVVKVTSSFAAWLETNLENLWAQFQHSQRPTGWARVRAWVKGDKS